MGSVTDSITDPIFPFGQIASLPLLFLVVVLAFSRPDDNGNEHDWDDEHPKKGEEDCFKESGLLTSETRGNED